MSNKENEKIIVEYFIGERVISDDGSVGTIRYEGKVDGFEGNWYGIEWDDPKRGKHQGTVKGKQYFKCINNGSGSFMKFEKLIKGETFMKLISDKFHQKIGNYDDLYVNSTKEDVKIQIQMIGMDQTRENQKNFIAQTLLSGSHLPISEIDKYPLIYDNFKNLIELNLSNCLLNNWNQIAKLLKQLPNLHRLHLCNNRLSFNMEEFKKEISSINEYGNNIQDNNNVKELILVNSNLSNWSIISSLCKYLFKNVESICLSSNSIENTNLFIENHNNNNEDEKQQLYSFPNLKTLDLANNNIKSFNDIISSLGNLPQLTELNLNNNQITDIEFNDYNGHGKTNQFKNLKRIYLSNNKINHWKYIEKLDELQSLDELSIRNNPIIDSLLGSNINTNINNNNNNTQNENENDVELEFNKNKQDNNKNKTIYLNRLNIIPRISNLKKLNLSYISLIERKDAELYFLYENYNPIDKSKNNKKLNHLVSIHGEPVYTKISLQLEKELKENEENKNNK
ncbi:hypothetical protein RB653_006809 [Dictyostelium firmibasis]|uniref:CAP-Gly domain-containing protein n=1 Tax=Dictyostelium firmibasis TaxID=79012 RepID=A0AAN7YQJ6_9MYCE